MRFTCNIKWDKNVWSWIESYKWLKTGLTKEGLRPGQTRKHCCGNIWRIRCFPSMFPSLPTPGNMLRKQKMILKEFRNIFCFQKNVSRGGQTGKHSWETSCMGNNVSETMFPSLPSPLDHRSVPGDLLILPSVTANFGSNQWKGCLLDPSISLIESQQFREKDRFDYPPIIQIMDPIS